MKSVSVLIPCRNEERFIAKVLENMMAQDYTEIIQVLVMDGRSTDKTRDIISSYSTKDDRIQLIDNPHGVVPMAMNAGLEASKGDIIVRVDAHSEYPLNYVSRLVEVLEGEGADNTGGVWDTQPGGDGFGPLAMAAATTSPFGIGNAQYRLGGDEVKEVDTVPYGCYPKEVFEKIGKFDEELVRNQDDEFNARLKQAGGKILLVPDVKITYYARPTLRKLSKMFYQYGLFKPLVNVKIKRPATLRQFVPLGFILATFGLAIGGAIWTPIFWALISLYALYFTGAFFFAMSQAVRYKNAALFIVLPFIFWVIHVSYGWGYLQGIVRFVIRGKRPKPEKIKISR